VEVTAPSVEERPESAPGLESPSLFARLYDVTDNVIYQVGHMGLVFGQVVYTAVRYPRGYWADARDDMYYVLKRITIPAFFALMGYGLLAATFAVAILIFLGAANRLGTVYLTFIIREISPLLTSAVVAGAIGAATTSELGSRKIREELDALRVLGQDPVRMLVLPRVISLITITLAYNILGILFTVTEGLVVVSTLGNIEPNSFLTTFMENITVPEIVGNLVKMTLVGLLIGVISASKGMTCGYGAEGVGRAVNQSVVICLTAAYAMDVLFNMILLATNPNVTVLR
jgi:phospholipid/cholesterol/gamma-HCH transport system permease protein